MLLVPACNKSYQTRASEPRFSRVKTWPVLVSLGHTLALWSAAVLRRFCDAVNMPRAARHFSVAPLFEHRATSAIRTPSYCSNRTLCERKAAINIEIDGGETKGPGERQIARSQGCRSAPRAPKETDGAKIAKEDGKFADR